MKSLHHPGEQQSNTTRDLIAQSEPRALRTYTPTLAVLSRSAGIFHWTPEGRRLYDLTSGVLVANLGHHPRSWWKRFQDYLGPECFRQTESETEGYLEAAPLTAYNAITPVEAEATRRLLDLMQQRPGGSSGQCGPPRVPKPSRRPCGPPWPETTPAR
jgi:4-aminobutyrate aminotransferase-like enzyme